MPRINHNIPSMVTGNALRTVDRDLQRSLERLSTGMRINRAADDAAGLSVSEQLRTQVKGLNMGARNIQDGISLLNIAEGALIEVESMVHRMRELAIQASNDTLTVKERTYIQVEIDEIAGAAGKIGEIDRLVSGTQYNSQNLLNGQAPWGVAPGGTLHIGPNNDATGADIVQFMIDPVDTTSLTIAGLDYTTQATATTAIDNCDAALDTINNLRAKLGAMTNRLDHALNNQQNQETNMQAAESVIRDSDFALETSLFTRNQILSQSSTAMLAQANSLPQNILQLLKG
jgi:flagellin